MRRSSRGHRFFDFHSAYPVATNPVLDECIGDLWHKFKQRRSRIIERNCGWKLQIYL